MKMNIAKNCLSANKNNLTFFIIESIIKKLCEAGQKNLDQEKQEE